MDARIACAFLVLGGSLVDARAQPPVELDIAANTIGYSTQTQMLYATVPSSAGLPHGNHLIEISPSGALITGSVFVGSEPSALAISADAAVAYVGLEGAASARRVDLATLTAGIQFVLGNSPYGFGPLYATQIAVMPGASGTVAVSRHAKDVSPDFQGVAIFDDGVIRPTMVSPSFGPTFLGFGTQSTTLFGCGYSLTAYKLAVDASGVSIATSVQNLAAGPIVVDGDTIYAGNGAVVNGTQMQLLGTYDSSGPVVVDDTRQTVSFVNGTAIQVFDRDTFVPLFSVNIDAATGYPLSAAGCGSGCIGVVFDSGQIFVISDIEHVFADGFE